MRHESANYHDQLSRGVIARPVAEPMPVPPDPNPIFPGGPGNRKRERETDDRPKIKDESEPDQAQKPEPGQAKDQPSEGLAYKQAVEAAEAGACIRHGDLTYRIREGVWGVWFPGYTAWEEGVSPREWEQQLQTWFIVPDPSKPDLDKPTDQPPTGPVSSAVAEEWGKRGYWVTCWPELSGGEIRCVGQKWIARNGYGWDDWGPIRIDAECHDADEWHILERW